MNLEDYCRIKRYEFFEKIANEHNLDSVFVAHHADDVAETSLKRVFEGATLAFLSGMKESSKYKGLLVYRPLLSFTKKDLKKYLLSKGSNYINDTTNDDEKYLRARFRKKIIPDLSKSFGKEISKNLAIVCSFLSRIQI